MSYSKKYKERTIEYKQAGHTLEETHQIFKVSITMIREWERQLKETGGFEKKELHRSFRKNDPVKLKAYVAEHPDAYQREMAEAFGCSESGIRDALRRHKITKRPTQAAGWYYSHLERKVVYGYQVHAAIIGTGDISLCSSLKRCCSENGSKIDMTLDVIQSLTDDAGAYVLMDSWYTNAKLLDTCLEKDCHLIGAMKTNRTLYPDGKRTSAADLASSLTLDCFHPATVKGRTYMVYRYEGALNKIDHAVVFLPGERSWKKECSSGILVLRHIPS